MLSPTLLSVEEERNFRPVAPAPSGIARQTLALGAFDYVTKPIEFDYLKRALETFLLI